MNIVGSAPPRGLMGRSSASYAGSSSGTGGFLFSSDSGYGPSEKDLCDDTRTGARSLTYALLGVATTPRRRSNSYFIACAVS